MRGVDQRCCGGCCITHRGITTRRFLCVSPLHLLLPASCSLALTAESPSTTPLSKQRVFALDSLARKVISDLIDPATAAPSVHDELPDMDDLGLDERLRIDETGAMMLGQEHHFRDLLHPMAVPGSYLWGNVMLYE